jgi:hypothetical protein
MLQIFRIFNPMKQKIYDAQQQIPTFSETFVFSKIKALPIEQFRLVSAISFGVCEPKSSMAMPAYPADSTPHDTGGGSAPLQTVPQGWGRSWFWQTKDAHLRS